MDPSLILSLTFCFCLRSDPFFFVVIYIPDPHPVNSFCIQFSVDLFALDILSFPSPDKSKRCTCMCNWKLLASDSNYLIGKVLAPNSRRRLQEMSLHHPGASVVWKHQTVPLSFWHLLYSLNGYPHHDILFFK